MIYDFLIYFIAGITDDDLRETAYEILLAAAGASGYLSPPPPHPPKKIIKKIK